MMHLTSIDDGHYPKIKSYAEYDRDDVNKLITMNKLDEVKKVIKSISLASETGSATFITYLASLIQDKSVELTEDLHARLSEEGIHPSSLAFNYFVQSAAHFKQYAFLM